MDAVPVVPSPVVLLDSRLRLNPVIETWRRLATVIVAEDAGSHVRN